MRCSASNSFVLQAAINDAEQVFRALEYRVRHQKQLEEKRKLFQKMEEETKPVNQPEASSSSEKDAASDLAPPANEVSTSEAQSTSAPDASHETEAAAAKLEAKSAPAVSSTSDDNDNKSAPGTQDQQDTPDTQQVVDSSAPLEPWTAPFYPLFYLCACADCGHWFHILPLFLVWGRVTWMLEALRTAISATLPT